MARILVVDDSPSETHRFVHTLSGVGHQVLTADCGADGVDMAASELPDVILMDVVMPGVNGFQATRQISRNETTRHIPIIIVSTKNQEADRIWGTRQGAREYLTKPVNDRTLIATINTVLNG